MTQAVGDDAAIEFATGFYRALATGGTSRRHSTSGEPDQLCGTCPVSTLRIWCEEGRTGGRLLRASRLTLHRSTPREVPDRVPFRLAFATNPRAQP